MEAEETGWYHVYNLTMYEGAVLLSVQSFENFLEA